MTDGMSSNTCIYLDRGISCYEESDYAGAITHFGVSIALNPHNAVAYLNRGQAKYRTNDFSGAMADCDKAIELDPDGNWIDMYEVYWLRGAINYDLADYKNAEVNLTKARHINSGGFKAFYSSGINALKLGDHQEAIEYLTKAIALNRTPSDPYFQRGFGYCFLNRFQEALTDYDSEQLNWIPIV